MTRTYVRPSQLSVSEFCPMAAVENEKSPISREALVSTAWHAKLAGNLAPYRELHPDDRKEVDSYGDPYPCTMKDGQDFFTLDYASAEKELHVQVHNGSEGLLTEGTLDFAWVREVGGRKWAFVADLKRNTWAIPDGADSLQLAAYGHAYCTLRSCDGYTPGLWSGTDSEWTWGTPVDLTSPEALDLWLRLKRAAKNDARLHPNNPDKQRHVTGAHCFSCYGRMNCRAWATEALSGVTSEYVIDSNNATTALLKAKAMAEFSERITENVKAFISRGGTVKDPVTGKTYLPTLCKGRKALDQEALKASGVDLEKFQKVGKPYQQFSWRKP